MYNSVELSFLSIDELLTEKQKCMLSDGSHQQYEEIEDAIQIITNRFNNKQNTTKMKTFNKSIKVEVSIDIIANKLLDMISPDEKHASAVVETIIDSMMVNKNNIAISHLYNSLNGFSNDINFEVGDTVDCTDSIYQYEEVKGEVDKDSTWERKYVSIGECIIKEIDIHKERKVLVEYKRIKNGGEFEMDTQWVNHTDCAKLIVDSSGSVA